MQTILSNIRVAAFIFIMIYPVGILTAQNLDVHKWKDRLLLIYTDDIRNPMFQLQMSELQEKHDDFADRKLVLYLFIKDEFQRFDFKNSSNEVLKVDSNKMKTTQYSSSQPFQIQLIGLDGGIKLSQTKILPKNTLFRIIDSMPMRQAELRKMD